ncbi:MAG TPA: agmatine deiminase family protein [Pyrinomonadaceae bacterium]|nr:agmatine deiminase family protein [Pyrinomonadaceae bacterium]
MKTPTPAALGYHMPAEWQRHTATWLSWPKDPETWPDRVPQVQEIFLQMMAALAPHETVNLLVDDEASEQAVRARCNFLGAQHIHFHRLPTIDSWIRDYGPNFLVRENTMSDELQSVADSAVADLQRDLIGREHDKLKFIGQGLAYNDWVFNAWGDKYEELKKDDSVPSLLEKLLNVPRFEPGVVMEGGSIEVNGAGVVLTTEQCLLNRNRNPQLDQQQIEEYLKEFLGVQKVLWLAEGIVGDDTDGHIDDLARFTSPTTIVCAVEEDQADANYELLQDNLERLRRMTDVKGQPFHIVSLPMPGVVGGASTDTRNLDRLPASYANFYIANNVVLAPIFGHANDSRALETLQRLFPDRRVVGINCEPLIWGMGAIHCVTQQQPKP